jgi:glucan phosphoethanolaminetransferase (alkaline phosphatase superfamily)
MVFFLGITCGIILLAISFLHVYWAFGGVYALGGVIPTKPNETKVFKAPPFLTFLVALFLLLVSSVYIHVSNIYDFTILPKFLKEYGLIIFASIFMIRAIGDFKYVGFFKKIKGTSFAKNDSKYFSPLCLFLGVAGILIIVFGN